MVTGRDSLSSPAGASGSRPSVRRYRCCAVEAQASFAASARTDPPGCSGARVFDPEPCWRNRVTWKAVLAQLTWTTTGSYGAYAAAPGGVRVSPLPGRSCPPTSAEPVPGIPEIAVHEYESGYGPDGGVSVDGPACVKRPSLGVAQSASAPVGPIGTTGAGSSVSVTPRGPLPGTPFAPPSCHPVAFPATQPRPSAPTSTATRSVRYGSAGLLVAGSAGRGSVGGENADESQVVPSEV